MGQMENKVFRVECFLRSEPLNVNTPIRPRAWPYILGCFQSFDTAFVWLVGTFRVSGLRKLMHGGRLH